MSNNNPNWYTTAMIKQQQSCESAKHERNQHMTESTNKNENLDELYATLRDLKSGSLTIENAFTKITDLGAQSDLKETIPLEGAVEESSSKEEKETAGGTEPRADQPNMEPVSGFAALTQTEGTAEEKPATRKTRKQTSAKTTDEEK